MPAFAPVLRPPLLGADEEGASEIELLADVVDVVNSVDCVELGFIVFEGVSVGYVGVPDFGRYTILIKSSGAAARKVSGVGFEQSNDSPGTKRQQCQALSVPLST